MSCAQPVVVAEHDDNSPHNSYRYNTTTLCSTCDGFSLTLVQGWLQSLKWHILIGAWQLIGPWVSFDVLEGQYFKWYRTASSPNNLLQDEHMLTCSCRDSKSRDLQVLAGWLCAFELLCLCRYWLNRLTLLALCDEQHHSSNAFHRKRGQERSYG